MIFTSLLSTSLLLLSIASMPVSDILQESRVLAEKHQYAEALTLLERAAASHPEDIEIKLAIIRTLSWKGEYGKAEKHLTGLGTTHDNNPDVGLLRASLAYYRGDYKAAKAFYRAILRDYPEYTDARTGLERIERIQQTEQHADYEWQIDTGYEYSSFKRRNQPAWNQQFLQLTHFSEDKSTALYGKVTRYEQFSNIDNDYEAGLYHRFTPFLNGYAYGMISPKADFRPDYRIAGGGEVRLLSAEEGKIPVWMTLDTRYDAYTNSDVINLNPGLRVELWEGWSVSARRIMVDQQDAKRVYGEDYRIDGTIMDRTRVYVGYADAPETIAAQTIDTKTWFGGVAFELSSEITLRVGYARDDRENSFIRQVGHASISYRF
jgi:YaiO family outer membrane protein